MKAQKREQTHPHQIDKSGIQNLTMNTDRSLMIMQNDSKKSLEIVKTTPEVRWDRMVDWVTEFVKEITLLRSLGVITAAQIEAFTLYLFKDERYDEQMMKAAERWCKEGDWTWKGPSMIFTIQDFYPTKEQLESVNRRGDYIILTRNELALKIRKAAENAIRDYEASLPPPKTLSEQEKVLNDAWIEFYKVRSKTKDELSHLQAQVNTLENRNKFLENRNLELRKEIADYRLTEEQKIRKHAMEGEEILKRLKEKKVSIPIQKLNNAKTPQAIKEFLTSLEIGDNNADSQ